MTAGEGRRLCGRARGAAVLSLEPQHLSLMAGFRFRALQTLNFQIAQVPELPGLDAAVREEGKPHPLELRHTLPRTFKHSAYLMVAAFHEGDFIPGLIAFRNHANLAGRSGTSVQDDAVFEAREIFWRRLALQLDMIRARNIRGPGGEQVGQV